MTEHHDRSAANASVLDKIEQRLNESGTGEMGLLDTIHAVAAMVREARNTGAPAQPAPAATVETKPVWCPGCSREVDGICHHFNCAIGPNGLDAQLRSSSGNVEEVLNGIRDALESRGYFHMANGRDIGALLNQPQQSASRGSVCCYCDAPLACEKCGHEQPDDTSAQPQPAPDEMEDYRMALAWIERQSTDPKSRELASTALSRPESRTGKVCAYSDGCPPDGPVCHLCAHLQPTEGK